MARRLHIALSKISIHGTKALDLAISKQLESGKIILQAHRTLLSSLDTRILPNYRKHKDMTRLSECDYGSGDPHELIMHMHVCEDRFRAKRTWPVFEHLIAYAGKIPAHVPGSATRLYAWHGIVRKKCPMKCCHRRQPSLHHFVGQEYLPCIPTKPASLQI